MTTHHPVDSTYHPCCNAIGRHGPDCSGVAVSAKCDGSVRADDWSDGSDPARTVNGEAVTVPPATNSGHTLLVAPHATQRATGGHSPGCPETGALRENDVELLRAELIDRVYRYPVRLWPTRLLAAVIALVDVFFTVQHSVENVSGMRRTILRLVKPPTELSVPDVTVKPSQREGTTMTTTPTEVDAPTVECRHTWCESPHTTSDTEHFSAAYTAATGRTERIPTTIGVALSYSPDDGDTAPRLLVHTMSEDGELDVDACLTVDEAVALRDLLDTAISHALGVEEVAR